MKNTPRLDSRNVLLGVLDCAFDRRSWHGANLTSSIRGVPVDLATRRIAGRKSIWEQLLHAAYWKHVVLNKLAGPVPFPRPGSNWPKPPRLQSKTTWQRDVAMLRELHVRLRKAVMALLSRKLTDKTLWLIHGAAAHDVYHAGQIKLLRRLLASHAHRS